MRLKGLYRILLIATFTTFGLTVASTQERPQENSKQETPSERFFRKGGKTTKAKVISKKAELTTADISQGRDLALFEKDGPFDCGAYRLKNEKTNCDMVKIREFIWRHWHNKLRGYIRISFNSVDAFSTSHIFVEPDLRGNWHVAWRIVRHLGEIDDMPDIVSVECINPQPTSGEKSSYGLIFRDKDGDEAERL